MEQLTIKKVENLPTAKGAPYKKVDVMKSDGTMLVGVSAFTFKYPNLAELVEGAVVTAGIVIDGNYKNLISAVPTAPKGNNGAFKAQQIEKAQETKAVYIAKAQDNKEQGIKVSATMRDAVLIATSLNQDQWQGTTMQEEIRFWREWLWTEWDLDIKSANPF
jgi:hypothetical protein